MTSTVASKPAPYQELMEFLGKREASWEIVADYVDDLFGVKRPSALRPDNAQLQPDANGWYYHRAPTEDRERVRQHGLQPSLPRNNPHWPDSRLIRQQPEGVYVTTDPEGINYMLDGPTDVWRVPSTSVQSIERDPAMYGKGYIPHPVDAELWQPYERSNSFTGVPLSDEDLFWNADYGNQLAYDLDHYDEQRQQGNPWKIGLPTTAALTTGWKIHDVDNQRRAQTSVGHEADIWTNAHEANAALWELADLMRKIPANQQAQANEVMRHEGVKSAIAYVLKLLQQQWTVTPVADSQPQQETYDDSNLWTEPMLGPLDGVWSSVRQGGMTVPQQQRFKQQLEERLGPEQTRVVHTFPDGWTIRHLPTWGEIGREGEMMHHCWAGLGDDYPNEPAGDGEDMTMSLRDPNNWPHASFSYHVPSKTPYEFGGHGGYGLDDEDPKWNYIDQWIKHIGGEFDHPMNAYEEHWAKTAAFQAWKRGRPGRGLVSPAGEVYTWPEDEATHMDMAAGLGIPHNYDRCFAITPDGKFRMNAWNAEAESLIPQVINQTYLKPHPYYYPDYREGDDPSGEGMWRKADNFTNDSREWPDPTEPRASKPPAPRGCTCQWGDKLNCPVHGLNADPELAQLDHSWSLPENSPVGYPQDQPRSWTQTT